MIGWLNNKLIASIAINPQFIDFPFANVLNLGVKIIDCGFLAIHCKDLHLQYISTTTLEMYATSASGVRLQDVVHHISSTSISGSADVLRSLWV